MAPKKKATEQPTPAPVAKKGRGGGGRGQGRKPLPANTPGADAADAPKRRQQCLSDLLGERFAKKTTFTPTVGGLLGERAADSQEPLFTWTYSQGGDEDTAVQMQQRRLGMVSWDFADRENDQYIVLAKGPESYYVNSNDESEEVPCTPRTRMP